MYFSLAHCSKKSYLATWILVVHNMSGCMYTCFLYRQDLDAILTFQYFYPRLSTKTLMFGRIHLHVYRMPYAIIIINIFHLPQKLLRYFLKHKWIDDLLHIFNKIADACYCYVLFEINVLHWCIMLVFYLGHCCLQVTFWFLHLILFASCT